MASLQDQIDALYQLPPGEFTAARTALAKQLAGSQAATVKALQKPATVPWAVNQVYWRAQPVYRRLLQHGQALRNAQLATLKGRSADIREATEAHRKAVREAVHQATQVASEAGLKPDSEQLARMFEAISLAATPPAQPGRFTEAMQPAAFEALAGVTPAMGSQSATPSPAKTSSKKAADALREERKREKEAKAEQDRAEAELQTATRALAKAQAAEARAREVLARAESDVHDAEKAVFAARGRRDAARR